MKQGGIILESDAEKYRALGVFGQPVHRAHIQIQAALAQRLGTRHANFFARPQWEEGSSQIRWVAPVPGKIQHWRDMDQSQRNARALDLQIMRGEVQNYLTELKNDSSQAKGKGGGAAFATVLEKALQTPNDGHLHFVGDQPVMTFWGFTEQSGASFEPLSVVPVDLAPPAAAAVASQPAEEAARPVEEEAPRRPWWPWLLLALALLLLLLLLAWWWWDRNKTVDLVIPTAPVQTLPDDRGAVVDRDTVVEETEVNRKAVLTEEERRRYLSDISRLYVDRFGQVIGPDGKVIEGVTPGDLGLLDQEGPARLADPPLNSDTGEPVPPGQEDGLPAGPDQQPGTEPPGIEPPGTAPPDLAPPAQDPSLPDTPLNIPDASSNAPPGTQPDLGFMSGKWRSDSGLTDQDGNPLDLTYEFDDQGQGRSVVRRSDGVTCSAPAEATMDGGTLRVRERENLKCSDGGAFERSETICEKAADGSTRCRGSYESGKEGYDVRIQRASP